MDTFAIEKKTKPPRVILTEQLHQHLIEKITTGSVATLAKRTGLPYLLIYNIVHKRVLSLSGKHYRIIFGEEPPIQTQKKIDGARFRKMVALWLYLNDNTSKADLYLEFKRPNHTKKVDYRIFSGKIQSVDPQFVQVLVNKFSELTFLQRYAHISPKRYLGRSTSTYAKGECKRLPSWRAQKIIKACHAFIRQTPSLPLVVLPGTTRKIIVDALVSVLKARLADLLSHDEGLRFEKQILRPSYASDEYKKRVYGFTRFDMAGNAVGMKKKAFDLMVAKNCEIFRKICTYAQHWYLSDLYLKELSQKQYFDLITAKYEWLAQKADPAKTTNSCLQ